MRALLCLSLLLGVSGLHAAPLDVPSAPAEVTVYPQGAQVLRRGSVPLEAGEQTLLLSGLPGSLREDTLRLSVTGPQGTQVLGLRLRQAFGAQEAQAHRRELLERLQGLKDDKDDLADRISARQAEAEILKSVASKDAGKALDAKSLGGLAEGAAAVGRRLAALAQADRKDQRAQRGLDEKMKALQAEIDNGGPGGTLTRAAEADLKLPAAGTVTLTLSYFVDGAGWSPRYDLRLHAADAKPSAELDFLAELQQHSGEDWKGVKLSLSTARPSQDSQVPDPTQWWLDYVQPMPYRNSAMMMKKAGAARSEMEDDAPAAAASVMAAEPAAYQQAQTRDLGPATLFEVPRKQDIPSDAQAHRVSISSGRYPAELTLVAVPRLSPAGFIEAKILYQGAQPLLPGPAQLFRDGDLAGQADLAYTAPGEALTLGFGQDERIKVERIRNVQKAGSGGLFSGKDQLRYDWTLKVSNYHTGSRSIEVREQLPRSRQDGIKVNAVDLDPKPLPESAETPGLQVWKLELKAGESRSLRFSYEVKWPDDKRVQGLE